MRRTVRAVFGVPLYSRGEHLAEAIESLLGQDCRDLAIVVIDDGEGDEAQELLHSYEDPRLTYERNERRLGLVGNWKRCLERALELHPNIEYFAWASDHDVWHPHWLTAMLQELDSHPQAVVAYPRNYRVGAAGEVLRLDWEWDTAGQAERWARFRDACRHMHPGDIVYGLFRLAALRRCEFPHLLVPDRLLLAELSLHGEFRQVPEVLWYRRFRHEVTQERQRAAIYPGAVPLHAYLPWPAGHVAALAARLVVRGRGRAVVGRPDGLRAVASYAAVTGFLYLRRRRYALARWVRKVMLAPLRPLLRPVVRRAWRLASQAPEPAPAPSPPAPPREPDPDGLLAARRRHLVEVRQPLVLISQVQRSGGTLLTHLLDGHPACHVHPGELHIGHPRVKEDWPAIDLAAPPKAWFKALQEKHVARWVREGYGDLPFLFSVTVQRGLFLAEVERRRPVTQRQVLDCYMTAFFNAWLDNRNLHGPPRRWVVGFAARMAMAAGNRDAFFRDYPDGRLVSVLREPKAWYASARAYRPEVYGDLETAMGLWAQSARAIAQAHGEREGRVHVVDFEALVRETEQTVGELAGALDIPFHPVLAEPTMNGMPVTANSSFPVDADGVILDPATRSRRLTPEEAETVERLAAGLYEEVRALAIGTRQGTSTPQSRASTSASRA
jgi:hypothetical protein